MASRFLTREGYKVLYQNYRSRRGELDLVARDGDVLAFIEVKTRQDDRYGQPSEAVGEDKQKAISRAALAYLKELGNPEILFRFDIVEVFLNAGVVPECRLIRNAHGLAKPFFY